MFLTNRRSTSLFRLGCRKTYNNITEMAWNRILVCGLVAALLASGMSSSPSHGGEDNKKALPKFLARRETLRDTKDLGARQKDAAQTRMERMDRLAHLSEDERELMSKQIMHAISELMSSECMSDRDYQGWVDFGRRSAE